MEKKLAIIIKTYQDFIRTADENTVLHNRARLNAFFDAISDSYIPLLNMLGRLEQAGTEYKLGLVVPPVLCAMLDNPKIQELYLEYLDKRVALGKKESNRNKNSPHAQALVKSISEKYAALKKDFSDKYKCNLVKAFAEFQNKGLIEILGTCATDIFMPHYAGLEEAISAQIEMGLQSYKKYFGEVPDGFFIPELGYTPGIEKLIRAYGYTYTILHARSMLLTDTLPVNGIFSPVRIETSLVSFTADPALSEQLTGENGYCQNSVYRNENRDIGFELDLKKLTPVLEENTARYSTGYKYWKKDFSEEADISYNPQEAADQAQKDALDFVQKCSQKLEQAASYAKDVEFVTSVCCIDDNEVRKVWSEYLTWIENVLTNAGKEGLTLSLCKDMVSNQFNLEKIEPYYSSGAGQGYGENLLSSKNCWMMRYVRKATERMIDLAERFPSDTGLKTRLLNIGSVELLLAQASSLAKMIEEDDYADFAEERFKLSINAFTAVFDSLGSNTVSTEWLTCLESQDNIFPWINYKIFSKKK
ncbi:MAG: DUF1957 domain-containing protein [Treponema sp.]|nr:DUF1957 domain-containing protein [Treponema sp.]